MKKINFRLIILLFAIFTLAACLNAEKGSFSGNDYKIELLNCDGDVIRTWISNGRVVSGVKGVGYQFQSKETAKIIKVSGTLIITQQ